MQASSRWQPENTDPATPSSCYRCGEGHFSRECSSSVKVHFMIFLKVTEIILAVCHYYLSIISFYAFLPHNIYLFAQFLLKINE